MLKRKVNNLPEVNLSEVFRDFSFDSKDGKCTIEGIAALSGRYYTIKDGKVTLKPKHLNELLIFPNTRYSLEMLKSVYPSRAIIKISTQVDPDTVLDLMSYTSSKRVYNQLRNLGLKPKTDTDLAELSREYLNPNITLIRSVARLGKPIFRGSKIKPYISSYIRCTDLSLLTHLEKL